MRSSNAASPSRTTKSDGTTEGRSGCYISLDITSWLRRGREALESSGVGEGRPQGLVRNAGSGRATRRAVGRVAERSGEARRCAIIACSSRLGREHEHGDTWVSSARRSLPVPYVCTYLSRLGDGESVAVVAAPGRPDRRAHRDSRVSTPHTDITVRRARARTCALVVVSRVCYTIEDSADRLHMRFIPPVETAGMPTPLTAPGARGAALRRASRAHKPD